jgi:hypothetical protein
MRRKRKGSASATPGRRAASSLHRGGLGLVLAAGFALAGCKTSTRDASPSALGSADALPKFDAEMIPSIDVPRVESAEASSIKIDGVLDEPLWQKAARTGTFVEVGTGHARKELPVQGEARLFYTDQGLYIGFEVKDPNVVGGFPKDAVDPHLWERDTVEIMTKPEDDGTNKNYFEIQINPQNLAFDSRFDDYNQPRGGPNGPFGHQDYKATMQSAVVVHGTVDDDGDVDQGYTVEVFIDFRSFSVPAQKDPSFRGKTIRMNFYAMKNNGGVGWSPILGEGNFHKATRFGRVHFAD